MHYRLMMKTETGTSSTRYDDREQAIAKLGEFSGRHEFTTEVITGLDWRVPYHGCDGGVEDIIAICRRPMYNGFQLQVIAYVTRED